MRIGFNVRHLANPEMRGLARYTLCLLRALAEIPGVEPLLFTWEAPCNGFLAQIPARLITFSARRETLWQDWALPQMLLRERVDVFHAPADRGLPWRKVCPAVVTVHDSYERSFWPGLFPGVKSKLWYWKHELANALRADAVLTVSDTTRKKLLDMGIAPERKLKRVYLAPAAEFHPSPQPVDVAVLPKYSLTQPYIFYAGGYDRRKNVNAIVEAFDRANLPDYLLVISAHPIFDYHALVERWKKLRCFPRLRLIEAEHGEIPALYRQADFFVNASTWESFSFQTVECMASGTPLLTSDRGAIPEIAGDAAVFFDPDDRPALAAAMERMARDEALKRDLRARGFARVQQFSWRKTAEETMQVYQDVLRRAG